MTVNQRLLRGLAVHPPLPPSAEPRPAATEQVSAVRHDRRLKEQDGSLTPVCRIFHFSRRIRRQSRSSSLAIQATPPHVRSGWSR